jgi:hypothetical protein
LKRPSFSKPQNTSHGKRPPLALHRKYNASDRISFIAVPPLVNNNAFLTGSLMLHTVPYQEEFIRRSKKDSR